MSSRSADELRREILAIVGKYHDLVHRDRPAFVPGTSRIPYGGRVFGPEELQNAVDAALEFWLTAGRHAARLEEGLARQLGVSRCLLTSSGSSANLLALSALTSPRLGERRLRRNDEVITTAVGFATTVAPIVQLGAVPVFLDATVEDGTYNLDPADLEQALTPRTRAVVLAHTLGNPFAVDRVVDFCRKRGLWLVEDNCDALGAAYAGRPTGSFGDLSTCSFYPAHHITTGEGGAVCTDDPLLGEIVESFRDWGRDCRCPPGEDNTCGRRFSRQFGTLPRGYDHKYVYSHFGYNLKMTDIQAAIGLAQLRRLDSFVAARRRNWQTLRDGLADLEDRFVLPAPTPGSDPSWFGFLLTTRPESGLSRDSLVQGLEASGIQTRLLFAGNLTRHPCFDEMRLSGKGFRIVGELSGADRVTSDTFWVGVYPGLEPAMLEYMIAQVRELAKQGTQP